MPVPATARPWRIFAFRQGWRKRLPFIYRVGQRPCVSGFLPGRATSLPGPLYFPAALRNAALMRSCQPGPSSWKKSRTSRSIRRDTISLTPGNDAGGFGGPSSGLVVAALKACRRRCGRRVCGGPYRHYSASGALPARQICLLAKLKLAFSGL